jgi:predicted permease
MNAVFEKVALVMLPILLGLVLRAVRVFGAQDASGLRRFVVRFAIPLLAFFSTYEARAGDLKMLPLMIAAAFLVTGGRFLVGACVALAVRGPAKKTCVQACTALGNYGWLGLGVTYAVLGEAGLRLTIFFVMAWWPVFFTYGIGAALVHHGRRGVGVCLPEILQLALPPVSGLLLGLAANLANVPIPHLLQEALEPFAGMAVPLILLSVGLSLELHGVRRALAPALLVSLAVLAIGPLVGWGVAWLLPVDSVARGVIILEGAMPVAMLMLLLADHVEMDKALCHTAIVLSTLLSALSLPLVIAWLVS